MVDSWGQIHDESGVVVGYSKLGRFGRQIAQIHDESGSLVGCSRLERCGRQLGKYTMNPGLEWVLAG